MTRGDRRIGVTRPVRLGRGIAVGAMVVLASFTSIGAGTAAAQEPPSSTQPTEADHPIDTTGGDEPVGVTTSTLPEESGELGRIIPLPNSGHEPTSPGDRGGWQQVTLFFAICGVIVAIGVYVWWRSRRHRARLHAEGIDRVEWARSHGGDVRRSG